MNSDAQTSLVKKNTGFLYPYGLESPDVFWPAMIIPNDQIDASLPKISSQEMLLQFFEKKVAVVPKDDPSFVLWDPEIEPFKSFIKKCLNHKAPYIRKAAIFMHTGEIDHSLKWKAWKQISLDTQKTKNGKRKRDNTTEISRNKKQMDCDYSDFSDWTDASSLESLNQGRV